MTVSLAWSTAVASAMARDAAGTSPSRSVTPQRGPGGGDRRRRPSGEPPPLPRNLGVSGRVWVALAAVLVAIVGLVLASQALASGFDRWNAAVLRGIVSIRTGWLTTLMVGVNTVLTSPWTVGILRVGTLVALVGLRRWRHLGVFLGSVVVVELAASQLALLVSSPRPMDVRIIGSWEGFSFPSPPVAALAVTLVGMAYALLPPGQPGHGAIAQPSPALAPGCQHTVARSTPTACAVVKRRRDRPAEVRGASFHVPMPVFLLEFVFDRRRVMAEVAARLLSL